ncbi:hypothetical protein [Tychonema sp. LEGE 06208]|nr:hypothetical protein [Tychonema sp. LEGE 06208]
MQAKLQERLSPADAEVILGRLPERIQEASIARAAKIEYPIAATIEMAIASFQGHRSIRFRRLQTRTRAVKHRSGGFVNRSAIAVLFLRQSQFYSRRTRSNPPTIISS